MRQIRRGTFIAVLHLLLQKCHPQECFVRITAALRPGSCGLFHIIKLNIEHGVLCLTAHVSSLISATSAISIQISIKFYKSTFFAPILNY